MLVSTAAFFRDRHGDLPERSNDEDIEEDYYNPDDTVYGLFLTLNRNI